MTVIYLRSDTSRSLALRDDDTELLGNMLLNNTPEVVEKVDTTTNCKSTRPQNCNYFIRTSAFGQYHPGRSLLSETLFT